MSRLIDADVLKLGIISQSNAGRESYSTEIICDFIDEQPTVGEWIPADKPPKPEEYVLLSFENFSVPMVGMYRDRGNGGAYYIGDDEESCISQYMFVNAWMSLPKPYDTEGDEHE